MKRTVVSASAVLALLIVALLAAGATYEPEPNAPAGSDGQYIDVDGERLRYVQRGSGPDILLIHGTPGSLEDWEPVLQRLALRYRVTAYDRPGHGYSSAHVARSTFAGNAEMASALIRALGLRDVVVVGHSYGGDTALWMAVHGAADVKSFVVVDSPAYEAVPADPLFHLLALPAIGTGIARVVSPLVAERKIRSGIKLQFAGADADEAFIAWRVQVWSQPKVTVTLAHEMLGSAAGLADMSAHYGSIEKPITLVYQERDPRRRAAAERLKADIPHATLLLLPDTGHYIQFQKPSELVQAIDALAMR